MIFRRGTRLGTSEIWRIGALLAAALLPLAILNSPVANAAPRAVACPPILFLGAHGVNEGTTSGGTQDDVAHWGAEMETVWTAFYSNGVDAKAEAVNFPEIKINLSPTGPSPWTTLLAEVVSTQPATTAGAQSLVSQMWDTYLSCGSSTSFVLAGYSQGAWLIDMALRQLAADGPVGKAALANTKAVFLMGDPAWPSTTQNPNREGIATWAGLGYSSEKAYLANGVSNFRSMCVSYAGGHFDPVCLGQSLLNPLDWSGFKADLCIHYSYASRSYEKQNDSCLGVTDLRNGIAANGGNWLATQIGGSAG